ncbi:MAG: helix-turn-helix domain-containing protein [Pseudomonadota bacterium]
MKAKSFSEMQCSIARTLEHVGSWWSLLIIRDAMMGARRFKHFEESLGIAKNTLTSRLAQLVEGGILEKMVPPDGSKHEEYGLTEKGRELAPVMIALAQWGDKWVAHEKGPSTEIIVADTGMKLPRIWPRKENGEIMELSEIGMKRSNGASEKNWFTN